jgi:YrbI family 3-deoxy-D-manno-octulosonate 8-phosphate phosphatase
VFPSDLADRVRRLKLIVFDFDGVFTDNGVYVFEDGREAVKCSRVDGMGIGLLRRAGLEAMVLSTEPNPVVTMRCNKLKLHCEQGCADKGARLAQILVEKDLKPDEVAYMGNDINDRECLQMVGLAIGPADAHKSVSDLLAWKTVAVGGQGAVREVCDFIVETL